MSEVINFVNSNFLINSEPVSLPTYEKRLRVHTTKALLTRACKGSVIDCGPSINPEEPLPLPPFYVYLKRHR